MYTREPNTKHGPLWPLTIRISRATKVAIERRAAARSKQAGDKIKPRQVARELLEYGLALSEDGGDAESQDELLDEVMASILFARRAFELMLSKHDGLAEKLLRASRAEVRRRKARATKGDTR